MTKGEARLHQSRATRERARSALTAQFDQVKDDLAAKGVGARAGERVLKQANEAAETGLDVARERKGVIAGTIGALLLWRFREPFARGVAGAFDRLRGKEAAPDETSTNDEEPDGEQGK